MSVPIYPWSAVVGQEALKRALLLCAIDPAIGGVLVQGPRGLAKTTLARALGEIMPGRFVELPLGATEERVTGSLDLTTALRDGRVEFAPGLLARAHHGVLYVDEVNLLPDALVDLLLDAAATGQHAVERDGVSHAHAARLVLIGTMNPEEGELRPQLLDRFGLSVSANAEILPHERVEIVTRRLAFDHDPTAFVERFAELQAHLLARCRAARERAASIALVGPAAALVAERCYDALVDGVRADLAMLRAARAHAAWHARQEITAEDVDAVAELALAHRRRAEGPNKAEHATRGNSAADGDAARGGAKSRRYDGERADAARGDAVDGGTSDAADRADKRPNADPTGRGAEAHDARRDARDAADSDSNAHRGSGRAGPNDTAGNAAGANPASSRGALAAVPVRAGTTPRLPDRLTRLAGSRAEARRRGAAQLRAAGSGRGGERVTHGSVDWFATLLHCRRRRPRARADLRFRARRAPSKQLWIVALDCSSSMLRAGALAAAKGVAQALEARALRAGAHVALIAFRGEGARVVTSSIAGRFAFERAIAELGGGGGTPLRQALLEALALCRRPSWRSPEIAKRLWLLTDGRTREQVEDLARVHKSLDLTVVDCERGIVRLGRAALLAAALGGNCVHVDALA